MNACRKGILAGLWLLVAGTVRPRRARRLCPIPPAEAPWISAGQWRYIIDKQRVGIREPIERFNFSRDEPDHNHPLIEYAWDTSPTFRVPGDWNSQVRELAWYEDMVWFRRTVDAEPRPGRRYFLYFEAVNYRALVYLNGEKLGEHEGGFTPFAFEVTSKLRSGRNSLVVSADARHEATSVPNEVYDWQNYGGITRPVYLIDVPETYIHDSRVHLAERWSIEALVRARWPAVRWRGRRAEHPGAETDGARSHRRAGQSHAARAAAEPRALVAANATPVRRGGARRRRSSQGTDRIPHDRDAGRAHPPERRARGPQRDFSSRRSAGGERDADADLGFGARVASAR